MDYHGDIVEYFDIVKDSSNPHILIHGCNCAGKYNSGVAKSIRETFPIAYESYNEFFTKSKGDVQIGDMNFVKIGETGIILNAFTQETYGRDKNIVYVDYIALKHILLQVAALFPNYTIILPRIGAGLGNGDWNIISKIIEESLKNRFYLVFHI